MTTSTKPVSAKATANKTPKTPVKTTTKTPKTPVKTTTKTQRLLSRQQPKLRRPPSNGNIKILWILLAILILIGIVIADKSLVKALSNTEQQQQLQQPAQQPTAANHGTWSAYGIPSFVVTDGTYTESGSDVFVDPTKGPLSLSIKPTEETCLLQYGKTQVFSTPFSANFESGDVGAGFRIIAKSYWESLPASDGAYQLCWSR